ncbi:hypothetical protein IW261DRAFT_1560226 [Armillaria novae-zelandiae]|uniref:Uncharacterized protein n=1 Tax=Armillaria novae-zelandiae TaxID=153914 RepID=A0AA39UIX1_9AGAR|nr:hypothetical protein IW261DRAFT_1560226 [Armillaria novae-zelandiae]
MPYQLPLAPGFAITKVDDVRLPGIEKPFVNVPPILSSDTRDNINSAGPYLLPLFNSQILSRKLTWSEDSSSASISNFAMPEMNCAIALTNDVGVGFVIGFFLSLLSVNCLFTPVPSAPLVAGELPVMAYVVHGVISESNLYFSLAYLLNHDQADLFHVVLGHAGMFSPLWQPFRAGARKTAHPPTIPFDDLEYAAFCLRRMPPADLEKLEIHVKGFLHVQNALHITDMGFREIIWTCCIIVSRALRKPEDDDLNGLDVPLL